MENKERIKGKIKALLSKTVDNGATKEEMESALNKANQLMTEFFISEYDLKDEQVIEKCLSKQFELTKSGFDLTIFYNSLARLFDCEYYYNSKRIVFFGHEQDVDLCGYFYYVITKTCLNEKDRFVKSDKYMKLRKNYHGRTLSSSFIKGFLIEVQEKMREMYENRKSNIPEGYGLIVLEKNKRVKQDFQKLDLKILTQKSRPITGELEAMEEGIKKGKEINLIQGLSTQPVDKTSLKLTF
ncbi:DUF2786 domain-containing protein [Flavobacterium sp. TN-1]